MMNSNIAPVLRAVLIIHHSSTHHMRPRCLPQREQTVTKQQKTWHAVPPRRPKVRVPVEMQAEATARAQELVDQVLKPKYIEPPPKNPRYNHIVDIGIKWLRTDLYFCATYASPGPNALSPSFESRFTRMEYIGERKFALSYLRHTGQWLELYPSLTLEECLRAIESEPYFHP